VESCDLKAPHDFGPADDFSKASVQDSGRGGGLRHCEAAALSLSHSERGTRWSSLPVSVTSEFAAMGSRVTEGIGSRGNNCPSQLPECRFSSAMSFKQCRKRVQFFIRSFSLAGGALVLPLSVQRARQTIARARMASKQMIQQTRGALAAAHFLPSLGYHRDLRL